MGLGLHFYSPPLDITLGQGMLWMKMGNFIFGWGMIDPCALPSQMVWKAKVDATVCG